MIPEKLPADFMTADSPISFLESARVRIVTVERVERSVPWFFRAADGVACFYGIVSGRCRIGFEGNDESISIGPGELAILLGPTKHWLQSDRLQAARTVLFRGRFSWNSRELGMLLPKLPPAVRIEGENGAFVPWVQRYLWTIADKSRLSQPGAREVMDQMAQVIYSQTVRKILQAPARCCYSTAKSDSRISSV